MSFTPNISTTLLLLTVLVIVLPSNVQAFGAGDIPDFAYLNEKAFRHGDIESILEQVMKGAGVAAGGGGLLGFAKQALKSASGGSKFDKGDIKKVYFGNWLRDYSQAMDIAGLSKLTAETLVLVVSVLGFMTFGFATEEFEVTADRLGVYLPVEHIDNPKGYAEKEGDARQFHPKLRPPVDPRELEIDSRTGMKNYMATENQGWDSSTAHIRRTFQACIEHGRRSGGRDGADLWEAYRLLGTGLHTMEDLLAHSNWCEIALRKMGHSEVFCHVGENTDIDTPNGRAPPLVTGTFGSADFLHSLLGEATDHLSQASVTSLSEKMDDASKTDSSGNIDKLKSIISKLPIGGKDDKMNEAEDLSEKSKAYNFNPDDVAPPEVQKQLLDLLHWRDGVFRWIAEKIEMIPGLSDLLDELTNALNAYVYTVIAPWLTPILTQTTSVLGEGSKAVIDSDDQYEVFDNPDASDPSHSLLSKDHFGLILNEPAGKIAQIVVVYSTELIVKAWNGEGDTNQIIDQILEAFHHPYFADGRSSIQHQMFEEMQRWFGGLGPDESSQVVEALTKESVRNGKNKRLGDEGEGQTEPGYGGAASGGGYGRQNQNQNQSYGGGQSQQSQYGSGNSYGQSNDEYGSGRQQQQQSYGRNEEQSDSYGSGRQQSGGYGRQSEYNQSSDNSYGSRRTEEDSYGSSGRNTNTYESSGGGYGSSRRDEEDSYGSRQSGYGQSGRDDSYGSRQSEYGQSGRDDSDSYGSRRGEQESYNSGGGYNESEPRRHHGGHRQSENEYGGRDDYASRQDDNAGSYGRGGGGSGGGYGASEDTGYGGGHGGGRREEESGYGGSRREESGFGGGGGGYGSRREEESGYGGGRREDSGYGGGGGGYGGRREESGYGGGRGESGYGGGGGGVEYGSSRQEESGYGGGYGGETREESGYEGGGRRDEGGFGGGYGGGGRRDDEGYGRGGYGNESREDETFGAERLNLGGRGDEEDSSERQYDY